MLGFLRGHAVEALGALFSAGERQVADGRRESNDYYTTLERTQKGALDIKPWQEWFLSCLRRAIDGSQDTLARVLDKARFWERFAQQSLRRTASLGAQ